jgi:hypothetical protein
VNRTDTSFTAKKVVIRQQNIASNTANSAATLPALIKAILPNCGHYNVNMRKEALNSLYKAIKEQSEAVLLSAEILVLLDSVFVACFRLICDDDASVRGTLAVLMACLFEKYPADNLSGFFARWMSFLSLATSHIKLDIRRDSVKFVALTLKTQKRLLLPHLPKLLTAMLPLVTAYPIGGRPLPAFDCVGALMEAYLGPFLERQEKAAGNLSLPLIRATWPLSGEGLCVCRASPFAAGNHSTSSTLLPPVMSPAQLRPFSTHLTALTISVFLDSIHFLSSDLAVGRAVSSSADYKQLQSLLAFYRKLLRMARVAGDAEVFWESLPGKIVKFRALLEPELAAEK